MVESEGLASSLAPGAGSREETAVTPIARNFVLWLTNVSHALNHFQHEMVTVLYATIMADLGFGYAQLGLLSAITNLVGQGLQGIYGFLAPFIHRAKLLGIGNFVLGLGTLLTGFVGSFPAFVAARTLASVGSSAQHPMGSSLLAGYFPEKRGTVLALNTSISFIGNTVAPILAALLLVLLGGWRLVFIVAAFGSIAMGLIYLFFRDRVDTRANHTASRRARLAQSGASYLRVLRNRNFLIVSLVMMVGAAGRGAGVNQTFIGPHLQTDLGIQVVLVGALLSVMRMGGIVGPIIFGWLSDRLALRKGMIQMSLLISAVATLWVAFQGAFLPLLFLSMLVYGMGTYSRGTLTQALIADSVSDVDLDAVFSAYNFIGFISGPIWAALMGMLMQARGFTLAFSLLAFSYVAGMLLMFFIVEPRRQRPAPQAG